MKARSSDWRRLSRGSQSGLVALVQVGLDDLVAAADALGDVVAGELDVDAAGVGAEGAVDLEEARDLVEDVVEAAGLVAARGLERVAVHRVADPGDRGAVAGRPSRPAAGAASGPCSAPIRVMK